jgi:PAS domain S-box-containing protein
MLDPDGRVKTWSAGAERITGHPAHEIVGKHFALFFTREDVAAGKPPRALAAAVRNGQHREEGWRVRRDGSRFQADTTVTPLFDPGGAPGSPRSRDVTAGKRAEEAREHAIHAREEILPPVPRPRTRQRAFLNTQLLRGSIPPTSARRGCAATDRS